MRDLGNAYRLGKVPLGVTSDGEFGAHQWREGLDPGADSRLLAADDDRAVGFQVADIRALLGVDVVHDRRVGEIAVKGKVAWDRLGHDPVDQLLGQVGVVLEGLIIATLVALAEAAKVKRVVFPTGVNVVSEQVIVGNQMALVGVIPEIANIVDQFASVVNQGVINRNDPILAIAGGRVMLEPFEAVGVDTIHLPRSFGQPAIEAGLVGGGGKLARDATDRLVFGHQQTSEVLGEVAARGLIRQQVTELDKQFLDHPGNGDNGWHKALPLSTTDLPESYAAALVGANLQKPSWNLQTSCCGDAATRSAAVSDQSATEV